MWSTAFHLFIGSAEIVPQVISPPETSLAINELKKSVLEEELVMKRKTDALSRGKSCGFLFLEKRIHETIVLNERADLFCIKHEFELFLVGKKHVSDDVCRWKKIATLQARIAREI